MATFRLFPKNLLVHLILILCGIVMIYPLLWMFFSSLKPTSEIFSNPSLLPKHWTINNYIHGWHAMPDLGFSTFFSNSFFVAIMVVVGTLISASLVAFAFARLRFVGSSVLFSIMMLTMMLPSQVTLIPQYTLFHQLNWINTYYPLTVPHFFGGGAFFIFLLIQFIRGIPRELDESAKIDGANTFQIYWRIVMPLTLPALVTTAIFSFIGTWDDFFGQFIYLNKPAMFTVPIGLKLFMDETGTELWGEMFAMSILSLLPILIIFLFLQRYIIKGIATSGLKG